jgi:hypothetical protein
MNFGVSPTKNAVVIAQTIGSGEAFVIKSIQYQARSGGDLRELLQRLVVIFDRGDKNRGSTIVLLGSSSGRFESSVEAIKGEAITELAAAESGLVVVRVTAASLKRFLVVLRGRSGRPVRRNGSIWRPAIRTGRKAQLAQLAPRLRPSRSLKDRLQKMRGIAESIQAKLRPFPAFSY